MLHLTEFLPELKARHVPGRPLPMQILQTKAHRELTLPTASPTALLPQLPGQPRQRPPRAPCSRLGYPNPTAQRAPCSRPPSPSCRRRRWQTWPGPSGRRSTGSPQSGRPPAAAPCPPPPSPAPRSWPPRPRPARAAGHTAVGGSTLPGPAEPACAHCSAAELARCDLSVSAMSALRSFDALVANTHLGPTRWGPAQGPTGAIYWWARVICSEACSRKAKGSYAWLHKRVLTFPAASAPFSVPPASSGDARRSCERSNASRPTSICPSHQHKHSECGEHTFLGASAGGAAAAPSAAACNRLRFNKCGVVQRQFPRAALIVPAIV